MTNLLDLFRVKRLALRLVSAHDAQTAVGKALTQPDNCPIVFKKEAYSLLKMCDELTSKAN